MPQNSFGTPKGVWEIPAGSRTYTKDMLASSWVGKRRERKRERKKRGEKKKTKGTKKNKRKGKEKKKKEKTEMR